MGFHFMDLVPILVIALALLGPKTLQSLSRSAGKGVAQTKVLKDKVMSELPMEEITKMSEHIPQVPLNSRQAVQMLLTPEKAQKTAEKPATQDNVTLAPEK